MTRNLARLADSSVDLLVIGAGIYGAAIAWEAAARGLSVAVIDRGDFGAATSFNSFKTIHGGLRELQRAAFGDMREFIRERRALSRIAPHLVHPLAFVVPTYRQPLRSRTLMRAVLTVHDLVAFDRNALGDPAKHLPRGRVLSRAECLDRHPLVDPNGVTGGAMWYDAQMSSADRLTLAFIRSACRAGASAANYVEAVGFTARGSRITGVRARDRLTGDAFEVRARLVINAAGPWAPALLATLGSPSPRPLVPAFSRAMNVVVGPIPAASGLGGLAHGRFLFAAPWRDAAIVGTGHAAHTGSPDALQVTRRDVEAFLAEARRAFPRACWTLDDVRLVHAGLLPARHRSTSPDALLKRSLVRDHRHDGVEGLVTVVGVRYTTARATAERAVDTALAALGRPPVPSRTATTPLVGGDIERLDDYERAAVATAPVGVGASLVVRLVRAYGTEHRVLLDAMRSRPELAAPLAPGAAVTRAEILHAIRHEMARRLADVVIRRTDLGSAGHPGREAVRAAGDMMAVEFGWTQARLQEELDEVDRFYRLPA